MTFVPDPDFAEGLTDTVAVEFDQNADGSAPSQHGGLSPNYQPVSGLGAVPCRIVERSAMDVEIDGKPGVIARARVLFGAPIALDRRNKLVAQDTDLGTRDWFVVGMTRAARQDLMADQVPHHWVVDVTDYRL